MFSKTALISAKLNKVEMVDAWTQTSNDDKNQSKDDTNGKNDLSELINRNSLKSDKNIASLEESTIHSYKSNFHPSKFRVRLNSSIKDNRTFRTPLINTTSSDYNTSKQYLDDKFFNSNLKNTSDFCYPTANNLEIMKRNNSFGSEAFANPPRYPFASIRKSPEKLINRSALGQANKNDSRMEQRLFSQYDCAIANKTKSYLPNLKSGNYSFGNAKNPVISCGGSRASNKHFRSVSKEYRTTELNRNDKHASNSLHSRSKNAR